MTEAGLVDWRVAGAVARSVARGSGSRERPGDARHLARICDVALADVVVYSGLRPAARVVPAELVDRSGWIAANLAAMRKLVRPLELRAAAELPLPRPLAGLARGALGAAAGAEAGLVLGYAARRVLGQYHLELAPDPAPPRLLLVEPNLSAAARELDLDRTGFLRWVALHEQTHAVQFAAVPWLRDHLAGLVSRLIASTAAHVDPRALAATARRLVASDPRKALGEVLRGELARALAGPAQRALLDELQATMAVVEGYAEHVMDAAAQDDPALERMRARLDARRARRAGLADVIARALGMGMKLRQYELGKDFSDAVAGAGGIAALNRVWENPQALPTLAELEAPATWLERVEPAASRSAA